MKTYTIGYYDIGWERHFIRVKATSEINACHAAMRATKCTFSEIFAIYKENI